MSLAIRRIIFYLLTLVFLISAPLLIAYTAGYRYNFKQQRIVKTGALIIATIPEGAAIILNGVARSERTPAQITNLTAGDFETRLERKGYFPWSKTLKIESEQTTFVKKVILFKKTEPRLKKDALLPTDPLNKIPSRFTFTSHEVWQVDPADGKQTLITRLLEEIKDVLALPEGNAVLLVLADKIRAVELDLRDRQNSWDLATFEEIKKTALSPDGRTLLILGAREEKSGVWELELY